MKVELMAEHLRHINPAASVRSLPSSVVLDDAAAALLDRDVIFLCTDEHWGRSIVNQIAYQYLIPVINLGMRIAAEGGSITAAAGVVDMLRPDVPCLWCKQALQAERSAAESMPVGDREALTGEGYVDDIDTPAPSVVSITTTLSGAAVSLFLQLLTDFMGPSGHVQRLNYNVIDGTIRRGRSTILTGCVCQNVKGRGDLVTLPTVSRLDPLADDGRPRERESTS